MSSGPSIVHEEEVDWLVLPSLCPLSLLFSACGVALAGPRTSLESLSIKAVDAITQDSPSTARSGVRGGSDMARTYLAHDMLMTEL